MHALPLDSFFDTLRMYGMIRDVLIAVPIVASIVAIPHVLTRYIL